VHYVSPTEDNQRQTQKMKARGLFSDVRAEIGQIIVAVVNASRVAELVSADRAALRTLIQKG
jgi:isocitrate lyase